MRSYNHTWGSGQSRCVTFFWNKILCILVKGAHIIHSVWCPQQPEFYEVYNLQNVVGHTESRILWGPEPQECFLGPTTCRVLRGPQHPECCGPIQPSEYCRAHGIQNFVGSRASRVFLGPTTCKVLRGPQHPECCGPYNLQNVVGCTVSRVL